VVSKKFLALIGSPFVHYLSNLLRAATENKWKNNPNNWTIVNPLCI